MKDLHVFVWGKSGLAKKISGFINGYGDTVVSDPNLARYHVSAQYPEIFTPEEISKYGYILNIHYSDTEVIRGCNVISHAIELGLYKTAVTFHIIDSGIDTGDILFKIPIWISSHVTAESLYFKCEDAAYKAFREKWEWLRTKPLGKKAKRHGEYFPRDLCLEMDLEEWQHRFIRSRTFAEKPRPYIVVAGRKIEL